MEQKWGKPSSSKNTIDYSVVDKMEDFCHPIKIKNKLIADPNISEGLAKNFEYLKENVDSKFNV